MYKELEKYKTKNKVERTFSTPDEQKIVIKLDGYEAPLGDLINDFIEHKSKPFWKKKYYHNELTNVYKRMLNSVTIKHEM